MMIIVLNGPLGVGKTETSWAVLARFDRGVMLDGDYIGAVHPFDIYDDDRVAYLYRTLVHLVEFHQRNGYENFVINYVFETPESLAALRKMLIALDDRVSVFRLVCGADELARRVRARGGDRLDWQLGRAAELAAIQAEAARRGDMGTPIATDGLSVGQVADAIWAQANRAVEIAPYNPAWPAEFSAEAARLRAAVGDWAVGIHHIGSTAVPGLAAKPIIDIMLTVRRLDDAIACIVPLQSLGYTFVDHPQNIDRRFFKRGDDPRTHHLHIVAHDGPEERRHLAFRDALRADDRLRDAYAALKIDLAARFQTNRVAYTDAKTDFIRRAEGNEE